MNNDRKKFTDYVLSIDMSEAARCMLCHDPVCSGACPEGIPVGEILKSLYFENYQGAAKRLGNTDLMAANAWDATCANWYAVQVLSPQLTKLWSDNGTKLNNHITNRDLLVTVFL